MDTREVIKETLNLSLDVIFPPLCLSCRTHANTEEEKDAGICTTCADAITHHAHITCTICGGRIPRGHITPTCHPKKGLALAACAPYENPTVRALIHTLKYDAIRLAIQPIQTFVMRPYIQNMFTHWLPNNEPYTAVSIPLHKRKERKRGFNQSDLIVHALVKELDGSAQTAHLLVKTKNTPPQAELTDHKERIQNITRTFRYKPKENKTDLKEKLIILVDDVTTSGATLHEAARTLRAAGARRIVAFTIAKA